MYKSGCYFYLHKKKGKRIAILTELLPGELHIVYLFALHCFTSVILLYFIIAIE